MPYDYAGGIHFHSSYSYDARVPLSQILKDAVQSGLHFAIVSDHFRLDARDEGYEGYYPPTSSSRQIVSRDPAALTSKPLDPGLRHAGVTDESLLLIVGQEVSPRYNHYLALGTRKPVVVWKAEANAQKIIDQVESQGGFGFISHPDHGGAPLIGSRAYPWIDWNVHGYAGMSIWDLVGDWSSSLESPWRTLFACLRPAQALKGPQAKTLARWDELAQKNHCVAIGEIDNHAHKRSFFGLTREVFPFEFAFRTIRTHVLLEKPLSKDPIADERTILDALRQGQSYVSLDFWNDPTGFEFSLLNEQRRVWPGGDITAMGPTLLETKLPGPGKIRLIRNGRLIKEEARRSALQWDVDLPGVYRVEAQQYAAGRWRPWIYSNPIWVK